MDITEEQRKRAEANHLTALNRLAALAKRKAILGSSELQQQQQRRLPQDPWKLFKCRKLSSEQPSTSSAESVPKALSPENFLVRLEVCSPDSFSVTPEAVQGLAYPGEEECLRGLTNCLSDVSGDVSIFHLSGEKMVGKKGNGVVSCIVCDFSF